MLGLVVTISMPVLVAEELDDKVHGDTARSADVVAGDVVCCLR